MPCSLHVQDWPRGPRLWPRIKQLKIGVLNDMSSLYADIGGPEFGGRDQDGCRGFRPLAKGWKIDVLSGDHQNKPDVGVNIARQWVDNDKVDAVADTPNSASRWPSIISPRRRTSPP